MKRVVDFVKEKNISSSDLIHFLKKIGVKDPTLNTKINDIIENMILNHFSKATQNKKIEASNFKIENPELITVFSENVFTNPVQEVTHSKYKPINSYFTDEQAKLICLKMANKRIRHFSNLFLTDNTKIDKLTLKYQIHHLANKALDFYGGKILTFIYKLQNWPSRTSNVEVIKMNPSAVYDFDTNFPKLQIRSLNQEKSFTVTFTRAYERLSGSYSALKITNNWTKKTARISINGQLIDNFEECIPEIALFKESLGETFVLYSGYDDDFCDICGRRLEDPISIKYGRGPTCRNNYGIP
jgi:hypothetical protein